MTGEAVKPGAGAAKREEARRAATVDLERERIEESMLHNLVALVKLGSHKPERDFTRRPRGGGGAT